MKKQRTPVLLVEEDETLLRLMRELLSRAGYEGICFQNADGAIEWLKDHKPALIISDIHLPGISGIHLCRLLKDTRAFSSIPVIILNKFSDEKDKAEAFKAGAGDYMVTPFSSRELPARVAALLRGTGRPGRPGRTVRTLASGAVVLNLHSREAALAGKELVLLPKEYALLELLLKNKGRVLTFSDMREAVWGLDSITIKATIKVAVYRLRGKLGVYSACIRAVPGVGYGWADKWRTPA